MDMQLFKRCLIIGEVAQAHDGSLGMAHAFIDAIANTGADAVKFQTHIAAAESTPAEPWRVKFSRQDATRYDYWRRMEFTEAQWLELKAHADERGLLFLSSPFSLEAVELLRRVGVAAWKVASGEVGNPQLFDAMLADGRPVLLSTGMSSWAEIDQAVARVKAANCPLLVMQCASRYPTPPEKVGLNVLAEISRRYACPTGLSDHSGAPYAGLAAVALGARAVEVHVTLSRHMFGPDVPVSLTVEQLAQLVEGARRIETMLTHPVDKDGAARELAPMRIIFTKSVAVRKALPAGHVLRADDLTLKKPGTGIPANRMMELVGRPLLRAVTPDVLLTEADVA